MILNLLQQYGKSLQNDLQIQTDGLALSIADIQLDHFLECGFVLATHLPQARQTRQRVHTFSVPRLKYGKLILGTGSGANNTHFAFEHVEELR